MDIIYRDSYSVALAHETTLFKLCALQTIALKSLEVIMTSPICVDVLISSKSKQSTDTNKNTISEKKKRDNVKENDNMNDILIFLFK